MYTLTYRILENLAQRDLSSIQNKEVTAITGPVVWTDAVYDYMASQVGADCCADAAAACRCL